MVCKTSCPNLRFELTCVDACPQQPTFTYLTPNNECIENCKTSTQFPYRNGATCDNKCLPGLDGNPTYFARNDPENICGTCLNYVLDDLECVTTCPKYYGSNNHCVSLCEPLEFVQNDVCVDSCDSGLYNIDDRVCVDECTGFYPLETSNPRKCESTCPSGTIRYLNTCVASCPDGKTFNSVAQTCLPDCQPGEIILDGFCNTGNCGQMFRTPFNECLPTCLDPYPFIETNQRCVSACDSGRAPNKERLCLVRDDGTHLFTILNTDDNLLYDICPSGFYDPISRNCLSDCPEGNYRRTTQNGTACSPNNSICELFTPVFTCVESCAAPYPLKSDRACLGDCEAPRPFRFQQECFALCPEGYYGDLPSKSCLKCDDTCTQCTGPTTC